MSINFGSSIEEERAVVRETLDRMYRDLYGNGRPGIVERILNFFSNIEAVERDRSKTEAEREKRQIIRHQENTQKLDEVSERIGKKTLLWTITCAAAGIASLLVAILAIYFMIRLSKVSNVNDLFRSQDNLPVLSYSYPPSERAGP